MKDLIKSILEKLACKHDYEVAREHINPGAATMLSQGIRPQGTIFNYDRILIVYKCKKCGKIKTIKEDV